MRSGDNDARDPTVRALRRPGTRLGAFAGADLAGIAEGILGGGRQILAQDNPPQALADGKTLSNKYDAWLERRLKQITKTTTQQIK